MVDLDSAETGYELWGQPQHVFAGATLTGVLRQPTMEEVLKVLCFFPSQIQKAVEVRKLIHFMVEVPAKISRPSSHLCHVVNEEVQNLY